VSQQAKKEKSRAAGKLRREGKKRRKSKICRPPSGDKSLGSALARRLERLGEMSGHTPGNVASSQRVEQSLPFEDCRSRASAEPSDLSPGASRTISEPPPQAGVSAYDSSGQIQLVYWGRVNGGSGNPSGRK